MDRQKSNKGRNDEMKQASALEIGLRDLFVIFFRAGLAFGGGLGILAVLEDEFVAKRKAFTHDEFLAMYGIGRIVPSGTMTALAVAFGQRFGGFLGTVVALSGLVLPALILTILLTLAYQFVQGTGAFTAVEVTILPAALAFIVVAAFRLGKEILRLSPELLLAAGAFVGLFFFKINPALLLLAGGLAGAIVLACTEKGGKDK
jgi:chromate transporter